MKPNNPLLRHLVRASHACVLAPTSGAALRAYAVANHYACAFERGDGGTANWREQRAPTQSNLRLRSMFAARMRARGAFVCGYCYKPDDRRDGALFSSHWFGRDGRELGSWCDAIDYGMQELIPGAEYWPWREWSEEALRTIGRLARVDGGHHG